MYMTASCLEDVRKGEGKAPHIITLTRKENEWSVLHFTNSCWVGGQVGAVAILYIVVLNKKFLSLLGICSLYHTLLYELLYSWSKQSPCEHT
jgi:hypothetical protein